MASSSDLKAICAEARPLIEQQLDLAELIAGLREAATAKGLDWSQIKALLKAQIQDERDETGDGRRVQKIVEKAEHASAYADMLGLANMNENIFSAGHTHEPIGMSGHLRKEDMPQHDAETGEITEQPETATNTATNKGESDAKSADVSEYFEDLIPGAGFAAQEEEHQPPVETPNDEAPSESAADEISPLIPDDDVMVATHA